MPTRILYVKFDASKPSKNYVYTPEEALKDSFAARKTRGLPLEKRLGEIESTRTIKLGENDEDSTFSEGVLISRNIIPSTEAQPEDPTVLYTVGFPFEYTDGPVGSERDLTETQAVHMTIQLDAEIQRLLAQHPEDPVEVRMVGASRGAVSASIVQRNLRDLYGGDARVSSRLVELDPVPGGGKTTSMRMQSTYDVKRDGACHPQLVQKLKEKHSPEAQAAASLPQNIRPEDRQADFQKVSVIYSINSEQKGKAFSRSLAYFGFDPQNVHGADQVIVIDAKHADLYDGLEMSIGKIRKIQELKPGVYVLPTKQEGYKPDDLVRGYVNRSRTLVLPEELGFPPAPPEGHPSADRTRSVEEWRGHVQDKLREKGLTAPHTTAERARIISSALVSSFDPAFRDEEFERTLSRPMTSTGRFSRPGASREGRPEGRIYTQPFFTPISNDLLVQKLEEETPLAARVLVATEIDNGLVVEAEREARQDEVIRTMSLEQIQEKKEFLESSEFGEALGNTIEQSSTILKGEPGYSDSELVKSVHATLRDRTPEQIQSYSELVEAAAQVTGFKSSIGQYKSTPSVTEAEEQAAKRQDFRQMVEEDSPLTKQTALRAESAQKTADRISMKLVLSPEAKTQLKKEIFLSDAPIHRFSEFANVVEAKFFSRCAESAKNPTPKRETRQQRQEHIDREVIVDAKEILSKSEAEISVASTLEQLAEYEKQVGLEMLQPERKDLLDILSAQAGVDQGSMAHTEIRRFITKAPTSELIEGSLQKKARDVGDILQNARFSLRPKKTRTNFQIAMREEVERVLYRLTHEQIQTEAARARSELDARVVVLAQTAQLPQPESPPQRYTIIEEVAPEDPLSQKIQAEGREIIRLQEDPAYGGLSRDDIKYLAAQMLWMRENPEKEMDPETIIRLKEKAYKPIEVLPDIRETLVEQIARDARERVALFRQAASQIPARREVSPLAQVPSAKEGSAIARSETMSQAEAQDGAKTGGDTAESKQNVGEMVVVEPTDPSQFA